MHPTTTEKVIKVNAQNKTDLNYNYQISATIVWQIAGDLIVPAEKLLPRPRVTIRCYKM